MRTAARARYDVRMLFLLLPLALAASAAQTPSAQVDQLSRAISGGDAAAVRSLLDAGVSPNSEIKGYASTWFPLFLAVQAGHVGVAELLLTRGADPRQTCYGISGPGRPFELAVAAGRADMVRLLMSKVTWTQKELAEVFASGGYHRSSAPALFAMLSLGVPVDSLGYYGETALHKAVEHGSPELVKFLLDRGASVAACSGQARQNALTGAARGGNLETLELILAAGRVGVDDVCPGAGASTAFAQAAAAANLPVMKRLLAAGAAVDVPGADGVSPLMWAARQSRSAEAVAFLLRNGADPNRVDKAGRTALVHLASSHRDADLGAAEALLSSKADPDFVDGKTGQTPLMIAIAASNTPLVELLAARADLGRRSRAGGHTALMFAVAENRLDAVLLLLVAGADVEAKDALGFAALDYARRAPGIALQDGLYFSSEPNPSIEKALTLASRRKAAAPKAALRGAQALERARGELDGLGF